MPMIDMPLDELRHYKGISPCPKDIDEFWDNAIKEKTSQCHANSCKFY